MSQAWTLGFDNLGGRLHDVDYAHILGSLRASLFSLTN